ncbi:MAG: hypothetical protein H6540_06190 [Bacteroidales bacterium]|nr:hypothetical protein [Bacteroidales bacterium]MCB9012782.1 hypothetical protein [Bacteroidales bacterium]
MKKTRFVIIVILAGLSFGSIISAQPRPAAVIEKMKNFNWMVGDWQGEAWYIGRDQLKTTLLQKEHLVSRVEGTIITMEGRGFDIPDAGEEAKIQFEAFGILTYDQQNSKFVMRAYRGGNYIDSDFSSNPDGSYSWGMEGEWGKIRYTLKHTEDDKWNEKGEYSRDGVSWFQNFEMTLTRQ